MAEVLAIRMGFSALKKEAGRSSFESNFHNCENFASHGDWLRRIQFVV
jgi:hypothetical protein